MAESGHSHHHDDHDHSGHSHGHDHHDHSHDYREAGRRSLFISLFLIGGFMIAEVIGGILSGSLALLADAGHMITDGLGARARFGCVVDWRSG